MIRYILMFCIFISYGSASYAGSYQGKVSNVFAYNGKVFVYVDSGSYDNSNTCTGSSSQLTLWLDPATDYGKALLSIVLTAKLSDRLVWVVGTNSCLAGPGGQAEELLGIDLKG